jgi:hypothetical protein
MRCYQDRIRLVDPTGVNDDAHRRQLERFSARFPPAARTNINLSLVASTLPAGQLATRGRCRRRQTPSPMSSETDNIGSSMIAIVAPEPDGVAQRPPSSRARPSPGRTRSLQGGRLQPGQTPRRGNLRRPRRSFAIALNATGPRPAAVVLDIPPSRSPETAATPVAAGEDAGCVQRR